jgi:hypothetical protein
MSAIRILSCKDVRQWLEGVRYPVDWVVCSWSTSIGSTIRHLLHERAAAFYARKHFEQHGRLPVGEHDVTVSVGPSSGKHRGDIRHPCGGTPMDGKRSFSARITYPPDPPHLEREGSGSAPARPRPGHPGGPFRF